MNRIFVSSIRLRLLAQSFLALSLFFCVALSTGNVAGGNSGSGVDGR